MLALLQHLLPYLIYRVVLVERKNRAHKVGQFCSELVIRQLLQHHVLQHIAYDVILALVVDRYAREIPRLLLVKLLYVKVHVGCLNHNGRGHHLSGLDSSQTYATLDNLAFRLSEYAFRSAYINHGRHLLTTYGSLMVLGSEHLRNEFGEQNQGIGDEYEHTDYLGGWHGERTPIRGSDCLWDDFGKHQNQ